MTSEPDLSAIDIKVRAQFFRDLFSRLVSLLQAHCTGYLIILSEQTDEVYIKLRRFIEEIVHTDGFEDLLKSYPNEIIPDSLHSLGEDADTAWEYGIQQALNRYMGEILEFCVSVSARYDDGQVLIEDFLEPYDKFIESFRREKREQEKKWLAKSEGQVDKLKQQFSTVSTVSTGSTSEVYVDLERIKELRAVKSDRFDLLKLIELCEELNRSYASGCYLAVAMLVRAILDHVPPILECKGFAEVASNYGGSKSFKQSMANLENSQRKIADAHLHGQIRKKETLPNKTQVNFSSDLDVLLAEIVRVLK